MGSGGSYNLYISDVLLIGLFVGRAKHRCYICSKECRAPFQLRQHIRTHTGERPFPCRLCSYAATTKGSCKRHMRLTHRLNESELDVLEKQFK